MRLSKKWWAAIAVLAVLVIGGGILSALVTVKRNYLAWHLLLAKQLPNRQLVDQVLEERELSGSVPAAWRGLDLGVATAALPGDDWVAAPYAPGSMAVAVRGGLGELKFIRLSADPEKEKKNAINSEYEFYRELNGITTNDIRFDDSNADTKKKIQALFLKSLSVFPEYPDGYFFRAPAARGRVMRNIEGGRFIDVESAGGANGFMIVFEPSTAAGDYRQQAELIENIIRGIEFKPGVGKPDEGKIRALWEKQFPFEPQRKSPSNATKSSD